jgi:mycoredoxin
MEHDLTFLAGHKLAVYSSHGCPDCTRLDKWLDANHVPHEKVWIDDDEKSAEKLESETGKQAVPFILLDDKRWVRGYHREERSRLSEALLVRELRDAIAG